MCPVALTDTVTLTYTAALENGEVIEQSEKDKPVTLSIGGGRLFKAVEASLFGMEPGETRQINIQPEDAYGHHIEDLVQTLPKNVFRGKIDPKPGMVLSLNLRRDGIDHQVPATVVRENEDTITVDYNHPLAGQVIVYTVTLIGINN
ncbi:MAG: peptidylprolyl isomerase [Desulfobulbus sp.]|nr:MAG: peptidylprolyl isomerase [Desulfobulbus sp.]